MADQRCRFLVHTSPRTSTAIRCSEIVCAKLGANPPASRVQAASRDRGAGKATHGQTAGRDGWWPATSQQVGGLLDRAPKEVAKLDYLQPRRGPAFRTLEGDVELRGSPGRRPRPREYRRSAAHAGFRGRGAVPDFRGHGRSGSGASPWRRRCRSARGPSRTVRFWLEQTQIKLMDQRRRLHDARVALAPEIGCGDLPQVGIDERQQFLKGLASPSFHLHQQKSDLALTRIHSLPRTRLSRRAIPLRYHFGRAYLRLRTSRTGRPNPHRTAI